MRSPGSCFSWFEAETDYENDRFNESLDRKPNGRLTDVPNKRLIGGIVEVEVVVKLVHTIVARARYS